MKKKVLIIGLTGMSGAGKSYVSLMLKKRGVAVIDTDAVYHEMISFRTPCVDEIAGTFGERYVHSDGSLDRPALGDLVFRSKEKLNELNLIAHKHILRETDRMIEEFALSGERAVIVEAPQLFESGYDKRCDMIVGVVADRAICIGRITDRDGISPDKASLRLANQHDERFFREKCETVIVNNGDDVDLQIENLYNIIRRRTMATKEELFYRTKNVYDAASEEDKSKIQEYADGYMKFLANAKIEREAVVSAIDLAEKNGFKPYRFGDKLEKGGRYYLNNRGKMLIVFQIGSESVEEGIRISAAHIDSPRLDLKQNPVYEDSELAYLKTHYYGGVKKYQWTVIPLALHGVVALADGSVINVTVGEDEGDPVFCVTDLLPHLAKDQMQKTLAEGVTGEALNILIGSEPAEGEGDDRVKLSVLDILNKKYGITEADFLSAELTAVPAGKPRDVGFDRSLIGAYGHDDKVCAYPALTAVFENPDSPHTLMAILADKEEIGSYGATGMMSAIFRDLIDEIADSFGANPRIVRERSKCLSADVNSAFDPNFAECYEKKNSSFVGRGVVVTKYTGSRGKGGANDASAEYVAFIRRIFNENGVVWQTGEIGKVDQGGGGTVAVDISDKNIDTIDLGVAVLSMHAPFEIISKADLYMTHKALSAFCK